MDTKTKYYNLTHPQQGIWYTEKMYPGTSIGNVVGTVKIKGNVDCFLFEKAINILLEKNDSIRMRVSISNNEPVQYISTYRYMKIDFFDFCNESEKSVYKWEEEETCKPFELIDSDLFYFAIIKESETKYKFYIKTHHLISDAWSMNAIVNQVMSTYSKLVKGESIDEDKNPSYVEYINKEIEYEGSKKFIKNKTFWNDIFENVPDISTLKTHDANMKSTEAKRKPFLIPDLLASKINDYCKENNISIFTFFLSILAIYINRISLKKDIVIGTPVLNRSNFKEKNMLGMFITTIPIRIKIDDCMDITSFIKKVAKDWITFLKHHEYPHEYLMKDIRKKHKGIKNLYDIVLSYQNARLVKDGCVHSFEGRWHFNGHQKDPLYIHINDREGDGNLIVDYDYLTQFFSLKAIEYIHKHMFIILQDAIKNPQKKICELEVLEEEEKRRILHDFNKTESEYPKEKTIHQLFEEQVRITPDKTALILGDKQLSYLQLNKKSNQLARKLRGKGVSSDSIVGIMIDRSLEMVIGMLAVLKAGGAFLPIDSQFPEERINYMLYDSKAELLLTNKELMGQVKFDGQVIDITDKKLYTGRADNLSKFGSSDNLAYIIFTSGSTGKPKGVLIEHKSLNNFVHGITKIMSFSEKSTVLSVTTISFDIFIFEMIPSLLSGATVVIANESQQKMPKKIGDLILKNNINKILTTPSQMQLFLSSNTDLSFLENVEEIMLGGEVFPKQLFKSLSTKTKARIFNGYGPTEITIGATFKELTKDDKVNIGKPIANTKIFILDNHLKPVPIGVCGEIYVGGDGLARGYLNDSVLTRGKFIESPFEPGKRLYKTGDIARWYPKGDIDFIGRTDHQVKIRGLRIELGEVESQLMNINGINNAIVIAGGNKEKSRYLCVYYTADKEIKSTDIRRHLLKQLPEYMVPSFYIRIDRMPYTHNGKIDIKELPQVDVNDLVGPDYVEPGKKTEKILAKEWAKVLGLEKIGIDNNFFELGGDSLAAIELQVRLLKYNINLKMQDLYMYSTIRELAEKIICQEEVSASRENENSGIIQMKTKNYSGSMSFQKNDKSLESLLLTGATGYLGIHVLEYLLNNTDKKVYCLVRGRDRNSAKDRLNELLEFYFGDKHSDIVDKRVFVVNGDITSENLGLNRKEYQKIGEKVQAIIHTAAIVKYYGNYSEFENINVFGTENIAKFAVKFDKPLYYTSTIGVSGQYLTTAKNEEILFTENDLYVGQNYNENAYVRSKFEAECLINKYIDNGLKVVILRVGNLTGRYSDGHFQRNIEENSFYNILKSIIEIGAVSNSILESRLELTPVDLCAEAVARLLLSGSVTNRVFHLYNDNVIDGAGLLKMLSEIGIDIKLLSKETFGKMVIDISSDKFNSGKLGGIVNFIQKENQLSFKSNIKLSSIITKDYLQKNGFIWPKIDVYYLSKLIEYMKRKKFLDII